MLKRDDLSWVDHLFDDPPTEAGGGDSGGREPPQAPPGEATPPPPEEPEREPMFDPAEGRRRRDEGIELVSQHSNNWVSDTADQIALMMYPGWQGTSDHFRILLAQVDWDDPPPGKENCWGALANMLLRRKVIEKMYVPSVPTMRAPGHGRNLQMYRSTML